jgi:hypothetical protein
MGVWRLLGALVCCVVTASVSLCTHPTPPLRRFLGSSDSIRRQKTTSPSGLMLHQSGFPQIGHGRCFVTWGHFVFS